MDWALNWLAPYYLVFKWLHVMSAGVWAFSTAVGYGNMVQPAYLAWRNDPTNEEKRKLRDWTLKKFDDGVVLEHVAFPMLIVTGLIMVWLNGWPLDELYWLTVKLMIIILVFVPMEIIDYHISHYAGRKSLPLKAGDMEEYERRVAYHWKFLVVSTWPVITLIPLIFFLAIVKPL